jgi:hypothetical protein
VEAVAQVSQDKMVATIPSTNLEMAAMAFRHYSLAPLYITAVAEVGVFITQDQQVTED